MSFPNSGNDVVKCNQKIVAKKDLINLDIADVRAAMRAMGKAILASRGHFCRIYATIIYFV